MRLGVSLPLVSYLSIFACVIYGLYLIVQPRTVVFFIDDICAAQVKEQCQTLLTPEYLRKHNFSEAVTRLKSSFADCADCSIRYSGFQKVLVQVQGLKPFLRINQNLVLTHKGTIVPSSELQETIVERLPVIKVTDSTLSQPETIMQIMAFMQPLPTELFLGHAIIWANKTAIYLIDQADPEIAIVATYLTRFTPELLHKVKSLREKIYETSHKGRISQKKVIDVRVKGQIIIKHMQGGDYENTSGEKYYNGN